MAGILALLAVSAHALDLTAGSGAARECSAARGGISFNASAIAYVEPGPLSAVDNYGGDRYRPARENNIAVGIGFSELAADMPGACVGLLYRADFLAHASRDLLDAIVANHFGRPFDAGRNYRLELDERLSRASGIRFRHVFDANFTGDWSMRIGVGASALKGLLGRHESLDGGAIATSGSYAVGQATWLRTDTDYNLAKFNPFVAPGTTGGYGFSTDLEFLANSAHDVSLDLVVRDALGRIYWHGVPQSLQTLDNAAIRYNADFNRDAFVTGVDSRIRYVQNLPTVVHAAVTIPLSTRLRAVIGDDLISHYHFPAIAARIGTATEYGEVNVDFRTRAIGVGAATPFLRAMVTANALQWRHASALGLSLQVLHPW